MPASRKDWTRDELLLVLRLYMRLPFGKLHVGNPEIKQLAAQLGRTPGSVGMKACNFASFDPELQRRGVGGLKGSSRADRAVWDEFAADPERIANEAEAAATKLELAGAVDPGNMDDTTSPPPSSGKGPGDTASPPPSSGRGPGGGSPASTSPGASATPVPSSAAPPPGETEVSRLIRARRVQSFFRQAVLVSYDHRCALSGIASPQLLTASHIIPWSESVERRADPTNGLCLNALFDRAFDRGLIAFDAGFRVLVSPQLTAALDSARHRCDLLAVAGQQLHLPTRFLPDPAALRHHREKVFVG